MPRQEWRAAAGDEDGAPDTGEPRTTQAEAAEDLVAMLGGADPQYHDGWIEVRVVSDWEAVATGRHDPRCVCSGSGWQQDGSPCLG